MASKINLKVNTEVNEAVISDLKSKEADLGKDVVNLIDDSDMCGRTIEKLSNAFTELNNIKKEISSLNSALIEFLTDANDNIIEADNSIAGWIRNGIKDK